MVTIHESDTPPYYSSPQSVPSSHIASASRGGVEDILHIATPIARCPAQVISLEFRLLTYYARTREKRLCHIKFYIQ